MDIVLGQGIFHSRYEQNSSDLYKDKLSVQTFQRQNYDQLINNNPIQSSKDKSSSSKRLLRAGKFFIGSFAVLALFHNKMIMKSRKLACKLALISAGIAAIHVMPHRKYS